MSEFFADRDVETTQTTGTGTLDLDGASTGFRTFVAGLGNGNTAAYVITDGVEWETGTGVVTDSSPDTLSRVSVLASSNGGSLVNWTNDNANERDVFCAPLADLIGAFPAGTVMLFQQTNAPTGWTKDAGHDNKALRIVSGSVSSGGATDFDTVFGSELVSGEHELTIAEMPDHDHDGSWVWGGSGEQTTPTGRTANAQGVSDFDKKFLDMIPQGGGGTHTHTLDLDLKYVDVIIASKD